MRYDIEMEFENAIFKFYKISTTLNNILGTAIMKAFIMHSSNIAYIRSYNMLYHIVPLK